MNRKLEKLIVTMLTAAILLTAMTACSASSESVSSRDGAEMAAEDALESENKEEFENAEDSNHVGESGNAEEIKHTGESGNAEEPGHTGDSGNAEEPKQSADEQIPESGTPYDELVKRYYTLVSDPDSVEDIAESGEYGIIESARSMGDSAPDAMGYLIQDISGDGVPELIVGILPEYGVMVNAVYTLVDEEPEFVFDSLYRSNYSYLGDGRFFYYGSGGASETAQGFYALTEDGTALVCEDFYFTHAAEGDVTDIRVYHNTTGSWDPADSEEADLSLEAFWAWEPSYEELPLIPFSSRGAVSLADAPVRAQWAEDQMPGADGWEKFVADDGEYAADVLFTAERSVTDFELVKLSVSEVSDSGNVSYSMEPIYALEVLTPERPLAVHMSFPGDLPSYGISYRDKDGDGTAHCMTVNISGYDGSIILTEIR